MNKVMMQAFDAINNTFYPHNPKLRYLYYVDRRGTVRMCARAAPFMTRAKFFICGLLFAKTQKVNF